MDYLQRFWLTWFSHKIKRCLLLGRKVMTNLDSVLKSETSLYWQKSVQSTYSFSCSHARMWELNHKEGWAMKNWCFPIMGLEKTLESPLDCKEIQPVSPKGNQPWLFIGRTDTWRWSSNTLATWCKEPTHWERPWCWEKLKAKREEGHKELDMN